MQLRFVYAASEETPTEEYSAEVVCLTVVGNTAVLSGLITRVVNPTSGLEEGDYLTFKVTDNGQPGSLLPDQWESTSGTPCPPPPGGRIARGAREHQGQRRRPAPGPALAVLNAVLDGRNHAVPPVRAIAAS